MRLHAKGDRVVQPQYGVGTVTDFIFFHWGRSLNAPIFNLADLSITSGVIVLALLMLREHNAEQTAKAAVAPPAEPAPSSHE